MEIGFDKISDELFRHLVIARLVYPVSKLKTLDYIFKYKGIIIDVEKVYRYLDKIQTQQMQLVQQISYQHTLKILDNYISIVFYDVTTLNFEAANEDDFRQTGFSKDGKHQQPQIVLGLLVSTGGYPLAYSSTLENLPWVTPFGLTIIVVCCSSFSANISPNKQRR